MRGTSKKASVLLAIILLVAMMVGISGSALALEDGKEIKIGFLVPNLTDMFGTQALQAVNMAIDEIHESGGINGYKIVMEVLDTMGKPDIALNATQKLLGANEVAAIIGPHHSSNVFAIDTVVKESDIPFIVGATNPGIPDLENPNIFGARCNDSIVARAAAKFIASQPGVTKVAVLCVSEDYGQGGMQVATAYFDEIGMDYMVESHNYGDTDMSASIMKVKAGGCDAVFIWTLEDFLVLIRQLYEYDFVVPTISNPHLTNPTLVESCEPEWVVGKYCTSDYVFDSPDPVTAEFVQKFKEQHGVIPDNGAPCYYSAAMVLFEAMKRCADPNDREEIKTELMKTEDFKTPLGLFNARPGVNQQLNWGINIVMLNENLVIELVEFVEG